MLGIGASGVWFSLRPPPRALLNKFPIGSAIAIPTSVSFIAKLGEWLPANASQVFGYKLVPATLKVALIALAMLVPFVLLGATVCQLLIEAEGKRIGRMYASDRSARRDARRLSIRRFKPSLVLGSQRRCGRVRECRSSGACIAPYVGFSGVLGTAAISYLGAALLLPPLGAEAPKQA
jgi:hypothetical protein